MSDKIDIASLVIKFSDLGSYDGIIESAVDLFDKDGIYKFKLDKYEVVLSGKEGDSDRKYMAKLYWSCLDEDAKGKRAISQVLLSGTDKNGKPLFRQLIDVLVAGGFSEDKVREFIKNDGTSTVEALLKALESKYNTVSFSVRRTVYENKPRTELERPVSQDRAKKAVEDGMHRTDIPASLSSALAGGTTTNLGGASAKPNGATAAAKSIDI